MCLKPCLGARQYKPIWLLLAQFFTTPSPLNPLDLMPNSARLPTAIQSSPSPVPIPFLNQSPFRCHITILALAPANGSLHKLQLCLNVIFGSLAFS